jgi:iron complex transport system ATP-binding protein
MSVVIERLSAGYGSTEIISGLDLRVAGGEWLGLIGPNGAGKSTLLGAIAGIVTISGEIEVEGRSRSDLNHRELARMIALVPQHPILPFGMTVTDYVLLGRTPYLPIFGAEGPADLDAVAAAMTMLELDELRSRPVSDLSGGEQQRAVLARALAQEPAVLLLDEPTTALDIGHRQQALELISDARRERSLTVLAAMHDLTLAGQFAERIVLMAQGEIVADGSAAEVVTTDNVRRYYDAYVDVVPTPDGVAVIPRRSRP